MPDGIVEDSRNSNSPQWGYLKALDVPEFCSDSMNEHPSEKTLMNYKNNDIPPWDQTLLFVNDTNNTNGPLEVGDNVCFKPITRTVPVGRVAVRYVIAQVLKKN